jgi:GntR family transcriptional repressor for pyruvate dehydrogenase complex
MRGVVPTSDPLASTGLPLSRKAFEFVAHELLVLILSGRFAAGDRLPSERELATQLGVSRPTVRQALSLLASHGLVESRMGSGTFVVGPTEATDTRGTNGGSIREVMEARLTVEVAVARLAARSSRRRSEDLELLRAIVEALERAVERDSFPAEIDLAFHRTVVQLTANPYLADLMAPLWQTLQSTVSALGQTRWTSADTARAAAEHRAVFEALRVRDPELAGFAMERHLRSELAKLVDEASADGPPPRFFA